jgi:hypothetical protein
MSITYEAVLDMPEDSVLFLSGLLHDEQVRRGTRKNTRAISTFKQAVLVLRWFLDNTRMTALARDNGTSLSTAYDYRDEGITVLAAPGGQFATCRVACPSGSGWRRSFFL